MLGDEHRETAVSLSDLASVLRLNGDLERAEALLRQCLEMNRKTRGDDHPNTAATLHDLALIAAAQGRFNGAECRVCGAPLADAARRRSAIGTRRRRPTLNSLAHVLARTGRYDEAASQWPRQ